MPPQAAKVLIVEDEVLLAIDEEMSLRDKGMEVRAVTTAERALEAIHCAVKKDQPFSVLSVDNNLGGGMPGYDLIRQLRRDTALKAVRWTPVVVHSSDRLPADLEQDPHLAYLPKASTSSDQYAAAVERMALGR